MAPHALSSGQPTGLLTLPNELLLGVAEFLPRRHDTTQFLRVNRRLALLLGDYLLRINIKNQGSSALLWGVRHDHVELVCRLVRLKADVNTRSGNSRLEDLLNHHCNETPLHRAVINENLRLVKILVGAGARMEPLWKAKTPLALALEKGNEPIARIFINRLKEIDGAVALSKKTPLQLACKYRLVDTVHLLLCKGAKPNWNGNGLGLSYVGDLLYIKDPIQRRLDDDGLKILRLLLIHGLEPNDDLKKAGCEHSDVRVRYMIAKASTTDMKCQLSRRPISPSMFDVKDNTSFPTLGNSQSHASQCFEIKEQVWMAGNVDDLKNALSQSYNDLKAPKATVDDAQDDGVEQFPSLGSGHMQANQHVLKTWMGFQEAEQRKCQATAASRGEIFNPPTAKHEERAQEDFPILGYCASHANKASSEAWTNFRDTPPKYTDCDLEIVRSTTSDSCNRSGRKNRWKRLQL